MTSPVVVDTGPIVAFLNRRDAHHRWARQEFAEVRPPLLTCEAVLSEACFLVRHLPGGPDAVLELVTRGAVEVSFALADELPRLRRLMARYADRPMSLADACLVRLAEQYPASHVFTTDGDFRVYRKNDRRAIPLIAP
ncbi:MAG: type II toxin-antitoxin system VapC family toxin [Deferrisomatales bacterium]